ncbi:MAG: HD domain-containing protein [Thermodesulfovibrionales bacterium]
MSARDLLRKYYPEGSRVSEILIAHSHAVAEKALEIAAGLSSLNPDLVFIEEAAMLHDIGILHVHAPHIGCFGSREYICHGILGREMLEQEGLMRHALVCERHVGVGITAADVRLHGLPLPERDMVPLSLEERIVCFADKFYSKSQGGFPGEKSLERVREEIRRFGAEKLREFDRMAALFAVVEQDPRHG